MQYSNISNMKNTSILTYIVALLTISGFAQIDKPVLFSANFEGNYNDQSTYGLSVTVHGIVTLDSNRFGNANSAVKFEGNDSSYLDFGTPAHLTNEDSFSISLWFKGGTYDGGDYEMLLHKYDLGIGLYDKNAPYFAGNFDREWSYNAPFNGFNANTWHQLLVIKKSDSTYCYRDNQFIGRIINTSQYASIWKDYDKIMLGKGFKGLIDNVYIFEGALDETKRTNLFERANDIILSTTSKFNSNSLSFYPNPTTNSIKLNETSNVTIYGLNGRELLNVKNTSQVNLSSLSAGIYFIKINETTLQKLIKK